MMKKDELISADIIRFLRSQGEPIGISQLVQYFSFSLPIIHRSLGVLIEDGVIDIEARNGENYIFLSEKVGQLFLNKEEFHGSQH